MRAAARQRPSGFFFVSHSSLNVKTACATITENSKIDGSNNEGGSELGTRPCGVLAEGSHVQQGLLDVVAKGRRPALRAVATSDGEEQRALLDGVRDADT